MSWLMFGLWEGVGFDSLVYYAIEIFFQKKTSNKYIFSIWSITEQYANTARLFDLWISGKCFIQWHVIITLCESHTFLAMCTKLCTIYTSQDWLALVLYHKRSRLFFITTSSKNFCLIIADIKFHDCFI